MGSTISLFSDSIEKKEIAIGLLKGRSCDNCLYYSRSVTTSSKNIYEWCTRSIALTKLRICKNWKGSIR